MATSDRPPAPKCEICRKEPAKLAEMYCSDCQIFLCMRCVKNHKKTPSFKHHIYMSSEMVVETLLKDIDNKNKDIGAQKHSNKTKGKDSVTESVKVMAGLNIKQQLWNIRFMEHDFRDIITRIKQVKTVQVDGWRLGVVNGNIWVRTGYTSVSVYNQQLIKIKEHKWSEISWVNTVQQISDTDVMLATDKGLYVIDTEGQYKYKVMDGEFTDISTDGNNTVVMDQKKVFLIYKDYRWKSQCVYDFSSRLFGARTLQLLDNIVILADSKDDTLQKVNIKTRHIIGSYEGQFEHPYLCGVDNTGSLIVCDQFKRTFDIIDSSGQCQVVKSKVECLWDVVVIGNNLYILHSDLYTFITQYRIDN